MFPKFESGTDYPNSVSSDLHVPLSFLAKVIRILPPRVFDLSVLQEEFSYEILFQRAWTKLPVILEVLYLLASPGVSELLDFLHPLLLYLRSIICLTFSYLKTSQRVSPCLRVKTRPRISLCQIKRITSLAQNFLCHSDKFVTGLHLLLSLVRATVKPAFP